MATKELKNIFLSASVPLPERDPKYYKTADVLAIRDAVVSLVSTILPTHRLVWGGHPSITPIINYVIQKLGLNVQDHVTLYQTKFFEHVYPPDNNEFKNVIQTENTGERESSLLIMRQQMLTSYEFSAGIFIGGMEGVEEEFELFREFHPEARLIPVASTGAAANLLFDKFEFQNSALKNEYAYSSLFKDLILNQ
jgi:hypothetical protein